MPGVGSVEDFRAGLTPAQLAVTDRLRALATGSAAGVTERIKWNAPSFAIGAVDRITLGIERDGAIRVVLHRGAKPRSNSGFSFDAGTPLVTLLTWAAPDRAIMRFATPEDVADHEHEISDVFRRWMEID